MHRSPGCHGLRSSVGQAVDEAVGNNTLDFCVVLLQNTHTRQWPMAQAHAAGRTCASNAQYGRMQEPSASDPMDQQPKATFRPRKMGVKQPLTREVIYEDVLDARCPL